MEKLDIKIGQHVKIYTQGNEARYGVKCYDAIVSSIGRKWFKVSTVERHWTGEREQFSLYDGQNDGKGYCSNYRVYLDDNHYNEKTGFIPLLNEVTNIIKKLKYKDLIYIRDKYKNGDN